MFLAFCPPGAEDFENDIQTAVDLAWESAYDHLVVIEEWSYERRSDTWHMDALWKIPTSPDDVEPPTASFKYRSEVAVE